MSKDGDTLVISVITANKLETTFVILMYAIFIIATFIRLFFGVEITDEALYIAEGHIVTQGATPFVNMWSQSPGFALLNAPLIWLYTFIKGSTEGIFLYFRIISLLIKLSLVLLAIYILKPIIETKITAIWLLPFIAFVPHSLISMSYNTWSLTFIIISGVLATRSLFSLQISDKIVFAFFTGFHMCLAVLCYPTTLITAFLLFATLLLHDFINTKNYSASLAYIAGSILTGTIIFLFLVFRSGSFIAIFKGIYIILKDNPYHTLPKNITKDSIYIMFAYFKQWLIILTIGFSIFMLPVRNKKTRFYLLIIAILLFISVEIVSVIYSKSKMLFTSQMRNQITDIICRKLYILPLLFLPLLSKENKKKAIIMIFTLYLPSLVQTLSASFLSYNGFNNRYYLLFQGTILTIPFLHWTLEILSTDTQCKKTRNFFTSSIIALLFTCAFTLNYYAYMYRDNPLTKLDYKVNFGIYKGLYTTKEKGKGVEQLEKIIRRETNQNEKILFMDCVPMAYLMTDAMHCAPSTWDIQLYSYKFIEDALLRKYFKTIEHTPDKIIYIFTGRDKVLSIDAEEYRFNDFVNSNYLLSKESDGVFPIKIYTRDISQKTSVFD